MVETLTKLLVIVEGVEAECVVGQSDEMFGNSNEEKMSFKLMRF